MIVRQAVLSLVVVGAVVVVAGCSEERETPTGPTNPDLIMYTAIGASDAVGVGGSILCGGTLECPNGSSYVYRLGRRFQAEGKTVTVSNLGVPGAVMSPAIQELTRQIGRGDVQANFIENQVPFVSAATTHVTVFAGGNDANAIAQAVRAGAPASDTPNDIRAFVDQQVQQWGEDFAELIRRIRSRASNARIVVFNLPNLAALPYVAGNTTFERGVLQRIAVGLTDRINAQAGQNVFVIDLMCDARVYAGGNIAGDGFHPSDQGYQLMTDLAYPVMVTGAGSSPAPSCPQRTVVPAF
jgi:lysophospholipase L1-like esterase